MPIIPWEKTGESQTIAEGFGKKLTKQKFLDHRGEETVFYFVEPPSWSVVLPITNEGKVILVRQYKQGAEEVLLELPGGTASFEKESMRHIIQRELLEETGYESQEVIALGSSWMNSRSSHAKAYCFLAKNCRKVQLPHPDNGEQLEVVEISLTEWLIRALHQHKGEWDSTVLTLRALPHLNIAFLIKEL